jgi:hypothetical protein
MAELIMTIDSEGEETATSTLAPAEAKTKGKRGA